MYDGAAKVTVRDQTVKTYKQLVEDMLQVSHSKAPPGKVANLRKAIGARLDPVLGVDLSRPLGDRDAISRELATVAASIRAALK